MAGSLRRAVGFLTRLPVRVPELRPEDLARGVACFPVVGLGLGLGLAAAAWAIGGRLPPELVATLLVALLAAVTGALHLDGLADLFDGLGGGRGERERTLELMRDGRIGAHGATALVLVLAGKILALGALLGRADLAAVVAFPAVARWVVVPPIAWLPYARSDGLGSAFAGRVDRGTLAVATVIGAGVALWCAAASAALGALVGAVAFAVWLSHRLGGLTGDCYGALIELAELTFLVLCVATGPGSTR